MSDDGSARTPVSLLGRLRHGIDDGAAWEEFVRHYTPLLLAWGRRFRLQPADAEDVTQQVLIRLFRRLKTFDYDPRKRFRGFLRTLVAHEVSDLLDTRRAERSGDDVVYEALSQAEAREDLVERLGRQFDLELRDVAYARVRLCVEARTWEVFRFCCVEKLPGAEVAARLGLSINSVHGIAFRVLRRVQDEVERLERRELGDGHLPGG